MIQEQYVSFEIAKLLKEKGFDIPCYTVYNPNTANNVSHLCVNQSNTSFKEAPIYSAPTQSLAMCWLREIHKIFIQIDYDYYVNDGFYYGYSTIRLEQKNEYDEVETKIGDCMFNTYEEACGSAIKYCLENLI